MSELRDAIATAMRATWADLSRSGERFYGVALFTGPAFEYVVATASSEEGLDNIADSEEARRELKWSPADSPHHAAGEAHFERVAELLARRGSVYDLSDSDFAAEVEARSRACFEALAALDQEGVFGADRAREAIVLNVLQGDQSERSRRDNAARLNPAGVLARFAAELEIREAEGEHVTLGDSAYQIDALGLRAGILAASGSGGELFVWRDGVALHSAHAGGSHWALALADDRVFVSDANEVLVHDIGAHRLSDARRFATAGGQVSTLAVSADGATIACGSWDGRLTAWTREGSVAWEIALDVRELAFAPSGLIAAAGAEGVAFIGAAGEQRGKLARVKAVRAVAWSPDERTLAIGTKATVQQWRRSAGGGWEKEKAFPAGRAGDVIGLAFSPDGTRLASAHAGGEVFIWDTATGSARVVWGRQESMHVVVWLDDRRLACAGRDVDYGPPVYVFSV